MNDQTAASFPTTSIIDIRLDDDPRYLGTIHEDAVARARGYKAALVPGAFVYGHIGRTAVEAWGMRWITSGGMRANFQRPVYNGDRLTVVASALTDDAMMRRSDISVQNEDGVEVASGWIGMPDHPQALPDLSQFQVLPRPQMPIAVASGGLHVDLPLTTTGRTLTEADLHRSLSAFDERHPIHAERGIVHSGCLMRLAMGETNGGFKFPAPVVLTSVETQHFKAVTAGETLVMVGRISNVYRRKGKEYLETEEFLSADGALAARFLRTQIYGYAPDAA